MTASEKKVLRLLTENGYTVLHDGWPDFLAVGKNHGEVVAVELKAGDDVVRPNQALMHAALREFGVDVYTIKAEAQLSLFP